MIAMMLFSLCSFGQGSLLDKKVSIEVKNKSIQEILNQLNSKYQIEFSYSTDKIPTQINKSLKFKNETLRIVLKQLFEGTGVKFNEYNNQIILIPAVKSNQKYRLSGFVREAGSEETIPSVNIYLNGNATAVSTNNYGFFSISLASDTQELVFSYVGYQPLHKKFVLTEDLELSIYLQQGAALQTVEVEEYKMEESLKNASITFDHISADKRDNSPRLLGEKDVLAATRYHSGVNRETDISAGYNIRGGTSDQNLIIIDDAPIYNAFHLFGLYSIMNEDALKQMNLMKSGFPARYGGRLSSVIELVTKDGDKEKYHCDYSLGLIASHLAVDGPLIKNKATFFISGRRTFIDQISKLADDNQFDYTFYDLNLKLNLDINKKNRIFWGAYLGKDSFNGTEGLQEEGLSNYLSWGNKTSSLRWNHTINSKSFSNFSFILANYELASEQGDTAFSFKFSSGINDVILKYDIDYFINAKHHLKTGASQTFHVFSPGTSYLIDANMGMVEANQTYQSNEQALYIEDEWVLNKLFAFNGGLRFTHYQYRNTNYFKVEPRILATYFLKENLSFKASFSKMNQYVHLLSMSSGIGLPNDLWLPTTAKIKPEQANQLNLGAYFKLNKHWKFNLETYYKTSKHLINYAPDASLFALLLSGGTSNTSTDWEEKVVDGNGWSKGIEFQTEYLSKRWNAVLAYTLAYAKNQFDELNYGNEFWSNTDRRHNFSILTWMKINKHWKINGTWIYTTGTPFTLPTSTYTVVGNDPSNPGGGSQYFIQEFSSKNNIRTSPYHRLDLAAAYEFDIKKAKASLAFGAMNVYNRKNVVFYTVTSNNDNENVLKKQAFLGIIPTLTFNYHF